MSFLTVYSLKLLRKALKTQYVSKIKQIYLTRQLYTQSRKVVILVLLERNKIIKITILVYSLKIDGY